MPGLKGKFECGPGPTVPGIYTEFLIGCLQWSQCRRGTTSHFNYVRSCNLFQCCMMEARAGSEKLVFADTDCHNKPFVVLMAGKLRVALRFRKTLERDDDVLKNEECSVSIAKVMNF